jgi:hypothetical protein
VFAAALATNRYDPIRAVVLSRTGSGLTYEHADDAFPRGYVLRQVAFSKAQFDVRYFIVDASPARVVFVARAGSRPVSLDASQRRELRDHFRGDLA